MEKNFNIEDFIENFKHNCSKLQIKKFSKGETVSSYLEKRNQICIVISGEIDLIRYDYNGNKTIIAHYVKNDIFGEALYPANTNNELFTEARKSSQVLFFNYDSLFEHCQENCNFHKTLSDSLSQLFLYKIITLNSRIELLTKRGTRAKILSYFETISKHPRSKSFTLPYTYTDLADFLSVDRSAMMREIKLLIEDGFIKKDGNKITLLY